MYTYALLSFQKSVDRAVEAAKKVLDKDRNPRLPGDVDHTYSDKYELANLVTNCTIISHLMALERLGLTAEIIKKLDTTKTVTLRFTASESSKFLHEKKVEVPMSPCFETTTLETETKTEGSNSCPSEVTEKTTTNVSQIVETVTEYHYEVNLRWELSVYSGTNVNERFVLNERSVTTVVILRSNSSPLILPSSIKCNPLEVSLSWLLDQIDVDGDRRTVKFAIDKNDSKTRTPCRNKSMDEALKTFEAIKDFANGVTGVIASCSENLNDSHNPAEPDELSNHLLYVQEIPGLAIVSIVGLMEDVSARKGQTKADDSPLRTHVQDDSLMYHLPKRDTDKPSVLLSNDEVRRLFTEQQRQSQEKEEEMVEHFQPKSSALIFTVAEAVLHLHSSYIVAASHLHQQCVSYVEDMLRRQLLDAIGKTLTFDDVEQFLSFHNQKFLIEAPKSFCYAIRRPGHFPEGTLSIERKLDGDLEPIETHAREVSLTSTIKMPLSAACTVEFSGKVFLHGWLRQRFIIKGWIRQLLGPTTDKQSHLIARARQFSSFLLVVGTMSGHSGLVPKDAIILQNNDTVKIPLILNEIPTAKEFKDAIASLSPEQQDFARAFRSMQLESSVLGVCVIQIKPQLEELLGLPVGSLTKKMKLTQELMELFVDYQVPSDLLSYDGEDECISTNEKVAAVESHVAAVLDVIDDAKKKQLEDKIRAADMADAQAAVDSEGSQYEDERVKAWAAGARARAVAQKKLEQQMDIIRRNQEGCSLKSCQRSVAAPTGPDPANPCLNKCESASIPQMGLQHKSVLTINEGELQVSDGQGVDFASIPRLLDAAIEKYAVGCTLRSTTIKTSDEWERSRQENLLTGLRTSTLSSTDIKSEKDRAFDLLESLSRSGSLPIVHSELHVFVCVTHCFDNDIVDTLVQDNINPIEKLELSTLLMSSVINGDGRPVCDLIKTDEDKERLGSRVPQLMVEQ